MIRQISRKESGEGVWRLASDVLPLTNEEVFCYNEHDSTYFDYVLPNGEWSKNTWGERVAWQYVGRPIILD